MSCRLLSLGLVLGGHLIVDLVRMFYSSLIRYILWCFYLMVYSYGSLVWGQVIYLVFLVLL